MRDLNCDLGEGEPARSTRALMRWITSANVACGGHAGSVESMRTCIRLAKANGVNLGAHPGLPDKAGFGRREAVLTAGDLELLLLQQVGTLALLAKEEGVRLRHVKLHGALYHAVESSPDLAEVYVGVVMGFWPRARIFCRGGGKVAEIGARRGATVWREVFCDRAYASDGTLVPRGDPKAILTNVSEVRERLLGLKERSVIRTVTGASLRFEWETVCVHADSPNAVALARMAARLLAVKQ